MEKLLIFPFNGNGIEAFDCLSGQYEIIGFIDDNPSKHGKTFFGSEVFGRDFINKYSEIKILAVPGNPENFRERLKIIAELNIPYERFATVIHPNASISKHAIIGRNVLIMAGVVVTSTAVISDHVCILPNSVLHHDSLIGTGTLIGSNVLIAGGVKVGENCYIGSGSNIINGISIGKGTLIGLGTNLLKDTPEGSKVIGNPGRLVL